MIQVIDQSNAHLHIETLRSFAALRYEIFIKHRGWPLVCEEQGFEQDQFDDRSAVYLIATDHHGQVTGGARLLDTSRRSLLAEVFPYLVEGLPPADPKIFEVTRFIPGPPQRGRNLCSELLWALQAYGAWMGLTHFVSVSYLGLAPVLRRAGYRFRCLGRIVPMDGSQVAALQHDIDAATLERSRHRLGISGGLLRAPTGFAVAANA